MKENTQKEGKNQTASLHLLTTLTTSHRASDFKTSKDTGVSVPKCKEYKSFSKSNKKSMIYGILFYFIFYCNKETVLQKEIVHEKILGRRKAPFAFPPSVALLSTEMCRQHVNRSLVEHVTRSLRTVQDRSQLLSVLHFPAGDGLEGLRSIPHPESQTLHVTPLHVSLITSSFIRPMVQQNHRWSE